jgi:hypothetical protein
MTETLTLLFLMKVSQKGSSFPFRQKLHFLLELSLHSGAFGRRRGRLVDHLDLGLAAFRAATVFFGTVSAKL